MNNIQDSSPLQDIQIYIDQQHYYSLLVPQNTTFKELKLIACLPDNVALKNEEDQEESQYNESPIVQLLQSRKLYLKKLKIIPQNLQKSIQKQEKQSESKFKSLLSQTSQLLKCQKKNTNIQTNVKINLQISQFSQKISKEDFKFNDDSFLQENFNQILNYIWQNSSQNGSSSNKNSISDITITIAINNLLLQTIDFLEQKKLKIFILQQFNQHINFSSLQQELQELLSEISENLDIHYIGTQFSCQKLNSQRYSYNLNLLQQFQEKEPILFSRFCNENKDLLRRTFNIQVDTHSYFLHLVQIYPFLEEDYPVDLFDNVYHYSKSIQALKKNSKQNEETHLKDILTILSNIHKMNQEIVEQLLKIEEKTLLQENNIKIVLKNQSEILLKTIPETTLPFLSHLFQSHQKELQPLPPTVSQILHLTSPSPQNNDQNLTQNYLNQIKKSSKTLFQYLTQKSDSKDNLTPLLKQQYFKYNKQQCIQSMWSFLDRFSFQEGNLGAYKLKIIDNNLKSDISNWIQKSKNFSILQSQFFNLLNRGDDWHSFIKQLNKTLQKEQNKLQNFYFNQKFMFYLFWSHCDPIRKYKAIIQYAKYNPIPFICPQWPQIQNLKNTQKTQKSFSKLQLNNSVYLIHEDSTGILNLGLGDGAQLSACGKSEILNFVFDKNFQTKDTNPFSLNTIDIDYDLQFRPTRKLCIADVCGQIDEKVLKILSFGFQFLIVHVKFEEIQEKNEKTVEQLQALINYTKNTETQIILLLRDTPSYYFQNCQSQLETNQQFIFQNYLSFLNSTNNNNNDNNNNDNNNDNNNNDNKNINNVYSILLENISDINIQELLDLVRDQLKQEILVKIQQNITQKKGIITQKLTQKTLVKMMIQLSQKSCLDQDIDDILACEKIKQQFMQELIKHENDFFDENFAPCRKIMNELKDQKMIIWETTSNAAKQKAQEREEDLKEELQKVVSSDIMDIFQKILKNKNWYTIIIEVSRQISVFSSEKLRKLKIEKDEQNKKFEKIQKQALNDQLSDNEKEEIAKKKLDFQHQLKITNEKVDKQIISIEIFWRELMTLHQHKKLDSQQLDPIKKLYNFLQYGENFELIDGDNMSFSIGHLEQLAQCLKDKKICIVGILGPQSSGKSTLLNYLFGCQFSASVGRCTRGVYGSLVKVNNQKYDYVLVLDTEGLQDPNKPNDQFDRTIVHFCLSVCQILLINFKGEINQQMKQLLEVCIHQVQTIPMNKINDKNYFMIFNQNPSAYDLVPLRDQINSIKNNIIEVNPESQKEADKICKENNIVALGSAFIKKNFKKNLEEGVWEDWESKIPQESFAGDCLTLTNKVFDALSEISSEETFENWIKMAHESWNYIETHKSDFELTSLLEIKQDKELKQHIEQWKKEHLSQINTQEDINAFIEAYEKEFKLKIENCSIDQVKIAKDTITGKINDKYSTLMSESHIFISDLCQEFKFSSNLEQIQKKQIGNKLEILQQESIFYLDKYFKLTIQSKQKEFIVNSIISKSKSYQKSFPTDKIQNHYEQKYFTKKSFLDLPDNQIYKVVKDWANKEFDQLWTENIEKIKKELNLGLIQQNISNSVQQFYFKKEKVSHLKKDLIQQLESELDRNDLKINENFTKKALIDSFHEYLMSPNNASSLFSENVNNHNYYNLSLTQKINMLKEEGNYMNMNNLFQHVIRIHYFDRNSVVQCFKVKQIKGKLSQISKSTETKEEIPEKINKFLDNLFTSFKLNLTEPLLNDLKSINCDIEDLPFKVIQTLASYKGLEIFQEYLNQIEQKNQNLNKIRQQDTNSNCNDKIEHNKPNQQQEQKQDIRGFELEKIDNQDQFYQKEQIEQFKDQIDLVKLFSLMSPFEKKYNSQEECTEKQKSRHSDILKKMKRHTSFLYSNQEKEELILKKTTQDLIQNSSNVSEALDYLKNKNSGKYFNKRKLFLGFSELSKKLIIWEIFIQNMLLNILSKIQLPSNNNNDNNDNNDNNNNEDQWKNIAEFSEALIEIVQQQVDILIQKINKDLEYLGLKISDQTQEYFHTFGMVITSQSLCYAYKNLYSQTIQELQKEEASLRDHFIGIIVQDHSKICSELGCSVGRSLASQIEDQHRKKCQIEAQKKWTLIPPSMFNSKNMLNLTTATIFKQCLQQNSQDFVKNQLMEFLKNPIMNGELRQEFKRKQNRDPILKYDEQTNKLKNIYYYHNLEDQFDEVWNFNIDSEFQNQKNSLYRSIQVEIQNQIKDIQELIDFFTSNDVYNKDPASQIFQNDREYNNQFENLITQHKEIIINQASYRFLKHVLLGNNIRNWAYIVKLEEKDYKINFVPKDPDCVYPQLSNFKTDLLEKILSTGNFENEEVQIAFPVYFLIKIRDQLKIQLKNLKSINYQDLGLAEIYKKCQVQSLGCPAICDFCKKKCDLPREDRYHKHRCTGTHMIRGMSGVKCQQQLSNKMCDEIPLTATVLVEKDGIRHKRKWQDIVQQKDWDYSIDPIDQDIQHLKHLYKEVWNKFGDVFAEHYKKMYSEDNILWKEVGQQSLEKNHYIFCIDSSGSMRHRFQRTKQACINLLNKIKQHHDGEGSEAKLTFYQFDHQLYTPIGQNGPENINTQKVQDKVYFTSGGTDFLRPMKASINQISNYQQFSKHIIYFFTDGEAYYPQEIEQKIRILPSSVRDTIQFHGMTTEMSDRHNVLNRMRDLFVDGSMKFNLQIDNLENHMIEIFDSQQHNIMI